MINIMKIVLVLIGTLIGAGFASGREIFLFFEQYGVKGIIGIIVSSIICGAIIYKVLELTRKNEINTYNQLLNIINEKHYNINKVINLIVNTFLLISFYIMIAGFSAYMEQTYMIPTYISSIIFVLICYIIFKGSIQGVVKANEILVPILIILIAYLGIKNISFIKQIDFNCIYSIKQRGWFISSVLYASYNSIILIPVLTSLQNYIIDKKSIVKISILSSVIITVLALFIFTLLLKGNYHILQLEMPLIEITIEFGRIFKYIYGFIIVASIFTSAISTGYSFLKNTSKTKEMYNIVLLIISITGIIVSHIGFSNLVEFLYPVFGILGILQIFFIFKTKTK